MKWLLLINPTHDVKFMKSSERVGGDEFYKIIMLFLKAALIWI